MQKMTKKQAAELGIKLGEQWGRSASDRQIDALAQLGEILSIAIDDAYTKLDWVYFAIQPNERGERDESKRFWLDLLASVGEESESLDRYIAVDFDIASAFIEAAVAVTDIK